MVLVSFCVGETEFRPTTSLGHTILFISEYLGGIFIGWW
jgi:hypothetical protein